jgi:hypothetical protein
VRGDLTEADAEQVVALWEQSGVLRGDDARARLAEVLCVLRGDDGAVDGVNWAYPDHVALVGGRRFWMYQSVLAADAGDAGPAMLDHAFAALQSGFDPDARGPIGVCVVIHDRAEMQRRPEAEWHDPWMLYAGYLPDGGQVRVGYFAGSTI